jgi:two-component system sensor kinase FixL
MSSIPNNPDEQIGDPRLVVLHQLSRGLTHDLRTPLTVIRNALFFLRRSAPLDADVVESLDLIDSEVVSINAILTRLMEITQTAPPTLKEVELAQLVEKAVARTDPERSATWTLDLPDPRAQVRCDPAQFEQVLHNLFRNALTAMSGRGEIRVTHRRDGDNEILEIRDTGKGVAESVRETLFEPFVTTKRNGLGLGLTYCRQVLGTHRGAIELAESSAGGSTLRITLPRMDASKPN